MTKEILFSDESGGALGSGGLYWGSATITTGRGSYRRLGFCVLISGWGVHMIE